MLILTILMVISAAACFGLSIVLNKKAEKQAEAEKILMSKEYGLIFGDDVAKQAAEDVDAPPKNKYTIN